MALFDSLAAVFVQQGGVQGVLDKINAAGYGAKVNSWLGKGDNAPITADEIKGALGDQHLQQLATSLGVPMDKVAGLLSQQLPGAVDAASPNGTLQG
jgi:uncharacterized protein YidB (DUF937 family)